MRQIIIILTILAVSSAAFAQRNHIERGDEEFRNFMYDLAKDHYERALSSVRDKKDIAYVNYRLGYSYKMLGEYRKSETHFRIAVENYVQDVIPPDVLLYYADALRMNGKYEDAIEIYQQYQQINPNDLRAQSGITSCELAPRWMNRPTRYRIENMSRINSEKLDFSPTWASRDFREIYFTTSRPGTTGDRHNYRSGQKFTDIYVAIQDRNDRWSEPAPAQGGINSEHDEGAAVISARGTEMFFTRCRAGRRIDRPCRIYYSELRGNTWSEPRAVNIPGFDGFDVGYPALSPDDRILYFASDKPGGIGGLDLYKTYRSRTGLEFSDPINLGPEINTPRDEMFPTVRSDGTLYFASDGHPGMGGLDMFKALTDENGNFTGVENLKYPLNSSFDDFGIIFRGDQERGYFTSNRIGGKGGDDIYSFHLPPLNIRLSGLVRDTTDMNNIRLVRNAKITIANDDGLVAELSSGSNGAFAYELEKNQNYNVRAEIDRDYFINSVSFTTHNIEYDTVINVHINMGRIERIINLPNIEYDLDKATLRPESTVALDDLVKTLNENPHIKIELRAHTDFRGSVEYNMRLSQARAQSCVDYLISKGIDSARLQPRGFAQTEPRLITRDIAKEHDFLSEGDVLTEEFILALPTTMQREIAHQLNRRTEFSVIATDHEEEKKSIHVGDPDNDEPTGKRVVIRETETGEF